MSDMLFPVIDLVATGENIQRLRKRKGLSVRDLQKFFGFEEPQAIYKWQKGKCLPTVDNLYALSLILQTPMNEILVPSHHINETGQSVYTECPPSFFRLLDLQQSKSRLNHFCLVCSVVTPFRKMMLSVADKAKEKLEYLLRYQYKNYHFCDTKEQSMK